MYARQENNEIQRYNSLPKELFVNDEWIALNEGNASNYGFKPITMPIYDNRTHKRTTNVIEVDGVYTYELESLGTTLDDIKGELTRTLKEYFKDAFAEGKPYTDFVKATGQTMPDATQQKINGLYGLLDSIKSDIVNLSSIEDALEYELPTSAINEGIEFLRGLI